MKLCPWTIIRRDDLQTLIEDRNEMIEQVWQASEAGGLFPGRCELCMHRHYCHQTVGYGYGDNTSYREVNFCSRFWRKPKPR